jgi:hypothetical protein
MSPTTKRKQAQAQWIRSNLTARAADGQAIDSVDLEQLPARFRADAAEIVAQCRELHAQGFRGACAEYARNEFRELANSLPAAWIPPLAEGPDPAVIDAIRAYKNPR